MTSLSTDRYCRIHPTTVLAHAKTESKHWIRKIELAGNESALWPLIPETTWRYGVLDALIATALAAKLGDVTRFTPAPQLIGLSWPGAQ